MFHRELIVTTEETQNHHVFVLRLLSSCPVADESLRMNSRAELTQWIECSNLGAFHGEQDGACSVCEY